ncbi:MAG: DUF4145 domain-containing protein [Eubacteriales bacterium]|nr:DUF4145 domain-containing protein [Eubacteriales bacterium]
MAIGKGQELMELAEIISRREYNWGLVRSRQYAEELVRLYCKEATIPFTTLADTIDSLHADGSISDTSRENLHSIRILGNKAAHEGDNDAQDAKNAYYLLKEELQTYASRKNRFDGERTPVDYRRPVAARQDEDEEEYEERPVRRPRQSNGGPDIDMGRAPKRGGNDRPRRKQDSGSDFSLYTVLKILIPVLIAVLLIILVISIVRNPEKDEPTTTQATSSEIEVLTEAPTDAEVMTTEAPTTEAPTTEAPVIYKTKGNGVRLRFASDPTRIYKTVENGTKIGTITDYNGTGDYATGFAQITYDNQTLIVSKDFIEKVQ